ncbi:MAG: acyl-CoA dehydrogenase family protein [Tardiphaga sp.]
MARLLDEIAVLAPAIEERAAEAEATRQIPADIERRLRDAGLYRMALPKSHGGLELDLPSLMTVTQRLARLDGSIGWVLGSIRGMSSVIGALFARERYDQFYRAGPDVTFSAAGQPSGTIEAVGDAWRVNGRWPFASGCTDADWFALHCVVVENGEPVAGAAPGLPATRFALVPPRQAQIEDSWYALGMKATDSRDLVVENVIIPRGDTIDMQAARPCVPGGLYASPFQIAALSHAAVALGIAQAAREDLLAMARSGRRQFNAPTAQKDSEIFLYEIAQADADLQAAQAYSDVFTDKLWQRLQAGAVPLGPPLPETLQAIIWVTEACRRVVRTCFELGGGSAVYDRCPLQRRLRDIETVSQHAVVQRRHYGAVGASLLAKA